MDWLAVAATEAEAAHVPSGLEVLITGVGKTAAAVATTRALAERADLTDTVVLNVGTAGALRPDLHGLFEPGIVLNHDLSADALRALGIDPQERLTVSGDPEVVLATGDTFVADPVVRDRLAERAMLVDMEGYAAARFGVPVRLVKHVSDHADESALDWASSVRASARVLGDWLAQLS